MCTSGSSPLGERGHCGQKIEAFEVLVREYDDAPQVVVLADKLHKLALRYSINEPRYVAGAATGLGLRTAFRFACSSSRFCPCALALPFGLCAPVSPSLPAPPCAGRAGGLYTPPFGVSFLHPLPRLGFPFCGRQSIRPARAVPVVLLRFAFVPLRASYRYQ